MLIHKIKQNIWIVRGILSSIYFNFHHLPFRQAIYMPILLRRPKIVSAKGKIHIQAEKITPGMIKLGVNRVSIYPPTGIMIENKGKIIFQGKCCIGNDSYISVGETGKIIFGNGFSASANLKIACYHLIEFGQNTLCGWECMFVDTDFHRMKYLDGRESPKAYGPIRIGDECWFGFKSVIQKNTVLPNRTTVASNSLVNKAYDIPKASIIAGQPAKLVKTGIYRDMNDDVISY